MPPDLGIDFTFLGKSETQPCEGFSSRTISEGSLACAECQVVDENPPKRRRDSIGLLVWMNLGCLHAELADRTIGQFMHTSWSATDGAPGDVYVPAKTTGGLLWLETI
jgi:hypothetical protein